MLDRREMIGLLGGSAVALLSGCRCTRLKDSPTRVALQLYSIRRHIGRMGIAKALGDVAAIGYEGVEVAGFNEVNRTFYGAADKELRRLLDATGLKLCGMHVGRSQFKPDRLGVVCDYALACGCDTLICPGTGNFPKGMSFQNRYRPPAADIDDWCAFLADYYNNTAERAKRYGCGVGLHNHEWEFKVHLTDGRTFFDGFFSRTTPDVLMEQDVGWTVAAGADPCAIFRKYPNRAPTLHAKENGYGCGGVFESVLGTPGKRPDGTFVPGVDWDALIAYTPSRGIKWYVVECEGHSGDLGAIGPSFEFLREKILDFGR